MKVDVKAFGRGKSASICKAVGEVRLRADSDGEAELLAKLGLLLLKRPDLLRVLLEISTALISNPKKVSKKDREDLANLVIRLESYNTGKLD